MKLANWRLWASMLLVAGALIGSHWAVERFTKPGHMSVLEAQAADMTGMRPPVGAVPVSIVIARRRRIESTVRYTGSAVPFQDQEITARVPGVLVWMPAYPGAVVHRGQIVARLDTRELNSRVNEQAAAAAMSRHATTIARMQFDESVAAKQGARARVEDAQSELAAAQNELASSQQAVTAAEEDRASAGAELEGARAGKTDAEAQLTAARADTAYWRAEVKRSQELLAGGVFSRNKAQQDQDSAAAAVAKEAQAQARILQADAAIRAAQGRARKADAMVAGAQAGVGAAQARVAGSRARVHQMRAAATASAAASDAALHEIAHSKAGEQHSEAQLATARVIAGYAEIRAEGDGVVTRRPISPGTLVQPGQAILQVSQISPIRLQANVAEIDLAGIRVGSAVRVATMKDPGNPIAGRVTALFPAVDPSSRTAVVEAVVTNRSRAILPGDYLTMEITTGDRPDALVVPAGAIVSAPRATGPTLAEGESHAVWLAVPGQPERTIYTCSMHPEVRQDRPGDCPKCKMPLTPKAIGGKWRAHLVPVTTGLANSDLVEIRQGLAAGALVIYAGYEGLREGDPVAPGASR
ncbi:MAG TPA: efflux RND transporter periplasmic adaptor subunit [Chthonomonadaceae bacterium]|nr:efflux RND transporter periplasmic adaptor subunit [Chthonomonadaceae bacterium]